MALSKIDISKAGITGTLAAANGGTGTTSYSPGKIGQVVQVIFETDTDFATSSFTDITGGGNTLAAAITPSAATSKGISSSIGIQHCSNAMVCSANVDKTLNCLIGSFLILIRVLPSGIVPLCQSQNVSHKPGCE